MSENFFADYKKFVVIPKDEMRVGQEEFDPKDYAAYYILTLSLFDAQIPTWRDAGKYEIDVEKSIKSALGGINQLRRGSYHFQLLELDKFSNYFVLAVSSKTAIESGKEHERIGYIVQNILTNPFYVGQNWFKLTGDKGKRDRKLFCFSFKQYETAAQELSKVENSKPVPRKGEIKLIKSPMQREILSSLS
ncbi:hypothetical protein [Heyndrickxia acidicola]|uniref:Uncharacterized protein n=1 Tax=Heyndrickxia acidicola TaxID=209389 RepID=A0ABU6MF00_9BACI|nr:hypothetical protein [Heyndrickxia acidicola]MED1203239.1 hypothetical protein [Heyndrickxia acidicola]